MKRGFTLVELLVVIAIIGILTTVGAVSLKQAREKAKQAAALQQMNTFVKILTVVKGETGKTIREITEPVLSGDPSPSGYCSDPNPAYEAGWPCDQFQEAMIGKLIEVGGPIAQGLTAMRKDPWGRYYVLNPSENYRNGSFICTSGYIDSVYARGANRTDGSDNVSLPIPNIKCPG